jgi:hypothetical protein
VCDLPPVFPIIAEARSNIAVGRLQKIVRRVRILFASGLLSRETQPRELVMSFVKTAFYAKNLPSRERVLRVVLAGIVAALALLFLPAPSSWALAISALGFSVTGIVGFCPACALVGRRLEKP